MSHCSECGTEIPESAAYCPDCGNHVEGRHPRRTDSGSDVLRGVAGGLAAFVAGFVATVVFSNAEEDLELVEEIIASTNLGGAAASQFLPEPYYLLGWEFLANHQVDISTNVAADVGNAGWVEDSIQVLLPSSSNLQFLPPALLLLAGFAVASRAPRTDFADAATAGAHVVAGYLPGIAALVYATSFELDVPVMGTVLEINPDVVTAVLVAGLAYPLAFGAIGGALAFAVAGGGGDLLSRWVQ